jgi:hypothetical protein
MNEIVKDTCKIGQAEKCCRYLVVGGDGFECLKLTDQKPVIDYKVRSGSFTSKGDNCLGKDNEKSIKILNS